MTVFALRGHFSPSRRPVLEQKLNELSLDVKAMNNLQSALRHFQVELQDCLPFIRMLVRDIRDYHTLSKYSLRRIPSLDIEPNKTKDSEMLKKEMAYLQKNLGENYLEIIKKRIGSNYHEIIIAIENQNCRP